MKAATTAKVETPETPEISIHAAREGGDYLHDVESANYDISIHAAREGGDKDCAIIIVHTRRFQSTPPVKAATDSECQDCRFVGISIHAAREGGDSKDSVCAVCYLSFQSTPPVKAATISCPSGTKSF